MKNMTVTQTTVRTSTLALAMVATLGLSGCALGTFSASSDTESGMPSKGAAMHGRMIGGNNPINGGHIYVFAAGASAAAHTYGTGATSLLTSAVLTNNTVATDSASFTGVGGNDSIGYYVATDASGAFSISNDYNCPAPVTQNGQTYPAELYLLAVGGDSGSGANTNTALIAALGPCTSASALAASLPFVQINEITTVAAVWSLQQFMSAPSGTAGVINIGAPTTNLVGLQNAFAMAGNLANVPTGSSLTTNAVATPESDRVNTLADIIAYCVNSPSTVTGGVTSYNNCANLYSSVKPSGTALSTRSVLASTLNSPADTVQAAWYLAQFPTNIGGTGTCGASGAAYACIQAVGAPFTAMSTSPTDWTLAVGYTPTTSTNGSALADPFYVVLDKFGNAWVDNVSSNSVVALGPNGQALYDPVTQYGVGANSGYAGYSTLTAQGVTAPAYTRTISHPRALTIDSVGNVWLADWNGSTPDTSAPITGTSFTCPNGDTCNFGTVAEFPSATGPGVASAAGLVGYYTPAFPFGAGSDANGNVYFSFAGGSTTYGSKLMGRLTASGAYTPGQSVGTHAYGLALDNNTTVTGGPMVWTNAQEGCQTSTSPVTYGSVIFQATTATIATATTDSGLTGSGTGCTSSVHDVIAAPAGLVVGMSFDASNNMWLSNGATDELDSINGFTSAASTVTYGVTTPVTGKTGVQVAAGDSTKSITSSVGFAGLNNPQYSEVDGAGNLWVANYGAASVSEVSVSSPGTASMALNALSGTGGFQHTETGSALSKSESIGIDLSGNVWVTNSSGTATTHNMTVIVGAATPVGPLVPGNFGVAP